MFAKGWISNNHKTSALGLTIFLFGIFGSEILLFSQGFMVIFKLGVIPYYYVLLLVFSGLMPIGIILLTIKQKIT